MTAAALHGRRLYVYYQAAAADLPAIQRAAREMQDVLIQRYPGLQAELLRRPTAATPSTAAAPSVGTVTEAAAATITLMEIYGHPNGVDDVLGDAIEHEALSLRGWLQGARHIEVFESLREA